LFDIANLLACHYQEIRPYRSRYWQGTERCRTEEGSRMLRIAFASSDRKTVNLHFGGAESLMLYDVAPGEAHLVGFAEFPKAEQVGETGRSGLTGTVHDKVLPKLGYVE
jgi:hypothetical protein